MIGFLKGVWDALFGYPSFKTVPLSHACVKKKLGDWCDNVILTDSEYKAVRWEDIPTLFSKNSLRLLKYRKDEYDCDDYARTASATLHILYGNVAVGEAMVVYDGVGTCHMLNFVVTWDANVVFVEPQLNRIIDDVDFAVVFMIL